MTRTGYILLALIVIAGISACCKHKVYCDSQPLKIAFVGFPRTEIRNIVLKRYKVNDTPYVKALDSAQFVYSGDAPSVPNKKDTIWLSDYTSNGALNGIYHGNDWRLIMTGNKYDYAFNMIFDEEHRSEITGCNDKETQCSNHITNFALNGGWNYGEKVYLNK